MLRRVEYHFKWTYNSRTTKLKILLILIKKIIIIKRGYSGDDFNIEINSSKNKRKDLIYMIYLVIMIQKNL